MFKFRNIDNFVPGRFERIGMLKGKRWYLNSENNELGLFKPQRFEFGNRKVFCANHYGEVVGHAIACNGGIASCPAELAHLSKYYSNIHKERNKGTPIEKNGCITYNILSKNSSLEPGQMVISYFELHHSEEFNKLTRQDIRNSEKYDNIEVILASIEARTREYYSHDPSSSETYIKYKINENKKRMLETIIYDCLYGNNDRHDENWSMEKKNDGSDISIYYLYDNERVLGLYQNQDEIETALSTDSVERYSENVLFSRMKVPGETKKHSTYKDVLIYLLKHYELETQSIINQLTERNTPEKISAILEGCEGLPECYKKFASQMYQIRYDFAKSLCIKKDTKNKDDFGMDRIYFTYNGFKRKPTSNTLAESPEL